LFQFFFLFFEKSVRRNFLKNEEEACLVNRKILTAGNLKILIKNSETQKPVSKLKIDAKIVQIAAKSPKFNILIKFLLLVFLKKLLGRRQRTTARGPYYELDQSHAVPC